MNLSDYMHYIPCIFHVFPYVYYTYLYIFIVHQSRGAENAPVFHRKFGGPMVGREFLKLQKAPALKGTGCGTPLDVSIRFNKNKRICRNIDDISISDLFTDSLDEERLNQQKVRCHRILATNLDSGCRGGLKQFLRL
jgi:hypothetical protein